MSTTVAHALALAFGALTGMSEIMLRYRDEPLRATVTRYGLSYLALNGLIATSALFILMHYEDGVFPGLKNDLFMKAIVAGFGAMAVFRSKLFTYRAEDGREFPVGPIIVLDTVLKVLDRKIDRQRSSERQRLVFEQLKDITAYDFAANYLVVSLLSYQNLTTDEKAVIANAVKEYREQTQWPTQLKSMALGFAFLTIAGEENFAEVVKNLKAALAQAQSAPAGGAAAPAVPGGV